MERANASERMALAADSIHRDIICSVREKTEGKQENQAEDNAEQHLFTSKRSAPWHWVCGCGRRLDKANAGHT